MQRVSAFTDEGEGEVLTFRKYRGGTEVLIKGAGFGGWYMQGSFIVEGETCPECHEGTLLPYDPNKNNATTRDFTTLQPDSTVDNTSTHATCDVCGHQAPLSDATTLPQSLGAVNDDQDPQEDEWDDSEDPEDEDSDDVEKEDADLEKHSVSRTSPMYAEDQVIPSEINTEDDEDHWHLAALEDDEDKDDDGEEDDIDDDGVKDTDTNKYDGGDSDDDPEDDENSPDFGRSSRLITDPKGRDRVKCDYPGCKKSTLHGSDNHELNWEFRATSMDQNDFCSDDHARKFMKMHPEMDPDVEWRESQKNSGFYGKPEDVTIFKKVLQKEELKHLFDIEGDTITLKGTDVQFGINKGDVEKTSAKYDDSGQSDDEDADTDEDEDDSEKDDDELKDAKKREKEASLELYDDAPEAWHSYVALLNSDPIIKETVWKDVRNKGLRLRREGKVAVDLYEPHEVIQATVEGDSGVYTTVIHTGRKGEANVDNYIAGYSCSCFPAGTMITMANGTLKAIEDIAEGDLVTSGAGKFRRVSKTMQRLYDGNLYGVKARGYTDLVWATAEHPWFVMDKLSCDRVHCQKNPTNCKHIGQRTGSYVNSNELKSGMHLQRPAPQPETSYTTIDISNYLDAFISVENTDLIRSVVSWSEKPSANRPNGRVVTARSGLPIKRFAKLDNDLAYVFGLFVGDGHTHNGNEIGFTFGAHEKHLGESVASIIEEKFGIKTTLRGPVFDSTKGMNNTWLVRTYSVPLVRMFEGMCGRYSSKKILSSTLMSSPDDVVSGIYRGWMDSDAGNSINRSLVSQMQQIALRLGINTKILRRPASMQTTKCVPSTNVNDIFKLEARFGNTRKCQSNFMDENGQWSEIASVESKHFDGVVYNLEVEEDHTYLAEGIHVHNCDWGRYAFLRETYYGRICSHGCAAYYEKQALDRSGKGQIITDPFRIASVEEDDDEDDVHNIHNENHNADHLDSPAAPAISPTESYYAGNDSNELDSATILENFQRDAAYIIEGNQSDDDIANAAEAHLAKIAKTSGKQYSAEEQLALIYEDGDASNIDSLNLENSSYLL